MIIALKSFLSVLMSIICFFTSLIFGDFAAGYEPTREDSALRFAVISDIHMTDETARRDMLKLGLYDMENAENKLDALVLSGDMTDHARSEEYKMLAAAFADYTPADNIIMAVGNHDTWNNETDDDNRFPASEKLFLEYNKVIANRELDKVYYSTQVNGYTFIVMSSEGDSTDAYISDEQLAWLDAELAAATKDGKPVFVICHWPINGTHGLPLTWLDNPILEDKDDLEADDGGLGNESEKVDAILNKYNNIYYITGHLHNGVANDSVYGYSSVEKRGNINCVNLPSYMYLGMKGRVSNGLGFVFEVYEDEVVIRARSFTAGVWYTNYTYNIPVSE